MMCCCNDSRFGKIIKQGKMQMRRELDLAFFLKKQRTAQATLLACTSFEQRRLIKQ